MDKKNKYLTGAVLIAIVILIGLFSYGNSRGCDIDKAALEMASQEAAAETDFKLRGFEQDLKAKLEQTRYDFWREFLSHNTMYADECHLWFSWFGYRIASPEDLFQSYVNNWWGCDVQIGIPGDATLISE